MTFENKPTSAALGVPFLLMMDKGSANTSRLFVNLMPEMVIAPIAHTAGSARVTGQLANARNCIERSFESHLSMQPLAL